jgi:hypothetical protein
MGRLMGVERQPGAALLGLQRKPGSVFWFPVVKKKVRFWRSSNRPNPARITVFESGE